MMFFVFIVIYRIKSMLKFKFYISYYLKVKCRLVQVHQIIMSIWSYRKKLFKMISLMILKGRLNKEQNPLEEMPQIHISKET